MEFKKTNNPNRLRPDITPRRNIHPASPPLRRAASPQTADSDEQTVEPTPQLPATPRRHRLAFTRKTVAITSVVLVVAITGFIVIQYRQTGNQDTPIISNKPKYQTVLPGGKSVGEFGGWKRISPPGKDPVFAYADKIGKVPVSVSEQPLPATFKEGTDDQMAALAEKFSATDKLDASGVTVYVGTSVKGPQSALLTKDGLLIMIKSEKKISDAAWKTYAASLR